MDWVLSIDHEQLSSPAVQSEAPPLLASVVDVADEKSLPSLPPAVHVELPVGEDLRRSRSLSSKRISPMEMFENAADFPKMYDAIVNDLEAEREVEYRMFQLRMQSNLESCRDLIEDAGLVITELDSLKEEFSMVREQTGAFQMSCESILAEKSRLSQMADRVAENASYFDVLDTITRRLNRPGAAIVRQPDFISLLQKMDDCLDFMKANPDFKDAELYEMRYRQCLTRALTLIRVDFVNRIKETANDVNKRLKARTLNDITQPALLYAKFKMDAAPMGALVEEIRKRCVKHEEYSSLLDDCLNCLFDIRQRLISPIVQRKIMDLSMTKELIPFARASIGFAKGFCNDEYDLFCSYFPAGGDEIYSCLFGVCEPLFENLRPRIIRETQLSVLCELCILLQSHAPNPEDEYEDHDVRGLDFSIVLRSVFDAAQTRVVFRAQNLIRQEIQNYTPKDKDVNYPHNNQLQNLQAQPRADGVGEKETDALSNGWYPSLRKSIWLLSTIYKLINSVVFDDLAHQVVHHCIASLDHAADLIEKRTSKEDSLLFLIKYLLILKDQIAAFDIEYVHPEVEFDFSGVPGALWGVRESGTLHELYELASKGMPRVVENMLDAKVELDSKLRSSINHMTITCAEGISEILRTCEFKSAQDFAEAISSLQTLLEAEFPVLRSKMLAYLGEGRIADILLGAVEEQIIQAYEGAFRTAEQRDVASMAIETDAFVGWMNTALNSMPTGLMIDNPVQSETESL